MGKVALITAVHTDLGSSTALSADRKWNFPRTECLLARRIAAFAERRWTAATAPSSNVSSRTRTARPACRKAFQDHG